LALKLKLQYSKFYEFRSPCNYYVLHFRSTRSASSFNTAEISSMASSQNLPAVLNDPRKGKESTSFD